ncbi:2-phospho-L-lactate guanylyltransferase [Sphingobium fontiphilum]|uniref:3-phospho-D-glycerate guanylyltransferase n=1 Tax=Sphingobium fontiphilum TaxID=944425 RepID=A0A7W6GPJ8_9SPHN|nr:2-phospho-L-lactate guanylyltransferase [Sphingobium fontiphilum]MBB3982607.1 2-phospho-L-lactate guanylyltransferase [Sphingobium fontiphilum]
MSWIAVLPLRQGKDPKTRLATRLSAPQRIALARAMAGHVLDALSACPRVGRIILLSPDAPVDGMAGEWRRDEGRGLNAELNALRAALGEPAMLVVHGDLPMLSAQDIAAMIDAAQAHGCALAPDQHGAGTNAVALADGQAMDFAFGPDSLRLHQAAAPGAALVRRPGLAMDVDTPDDLDAALAAGYRPG